MTVLSFILLCFLPLVLCLIVFCLAIKNFKIRYGLWASFLGFLSVIPIAFVQFFILKLPIFTENTLISVLITAMIFNGLIEESIKMLCMLLLPYKKTSFPVFFCMSLLTGLALGSFENVIYLFAGYHNIWHIIFSAMLIHTFCAGLSGIYIWSFRKKKYYTKPFIFSAALHGIYNFFAGFSGAYKWFSVIAILMAALECRICYTKLQTKIAEG